MVRLEYKTMSLGERILGRMRALGLKRSNLIQATGATKGAVSQWISDQVSPSSKYLTSLCDVLQCTPGYLLHGVEDFRGDNVSGAQYARGLVPLISTIQAGSWKQENDEFQPGEAELFLPCPRAHSKHTYALRVEGDSMTTSTGRSYPDKCMIYCDPEQVAGVSNGDPVIGKVSGEDEVTFKIYVKDGKRQYLKPLNSMYPLITDEFKILAKVIGAWIDS